WSERVCIITLSNADVGGSVPKVNRTTRAAQCHDDPGTGARCCLTLVSPTLWLVQQQGERHLHRCATYGRPRPGDQVPAHRGRTPHPGTGDVERACRVPVSRARPGHTSRGQGDISLEQRP